MKTKMVTPEVYLSMRQWLVMYTKLIEPLSHGEDLR